MRKVLLIMVNLALLLALFSSAGCDSQPGEEPEPSVDGTVSPAPGESNFNLIFKYGVGAKNALDTFEGTYTKDMIIDPSITVDLPLSQEEKDRIYQKIVEIDFSNYPDEFSVSVPPDVPAGIRTPYSSYYFRVEYDSKVKELWWDDEIVNYNKKASQLRELIKLIRGIIESSEEYQKLLEPRAGYA